MTPSIKKPVSVEEPKLEAPAPTPAPEVLAPAPAVEPAPAAEAVKPNSSIETIVGLDNSVRHIGIPNVF